MDKYTEAVLKAQGDEAYMAEAIDINMNMLYRFVNTHEMIGDSREDKISDLKICLVKAIRRWGTPTKRKDGRCADWGAYLAAALLYCKWNLFKKANNKDKAFFHVSYLEDIPVPLDGVMDSPSNIELWPIEGLSVRDGAMFEMRLFRGITYKELARVFGLSIGRLQQVYARIVNSLLEEL